MTHEALCSMTARDLAQAIRDRRVTAVEVARAHLDRIEAVNGRLNAVVQIGPDALAQAHAADEALRHGSTAPLLGVPFTVKDWIETAGLICAAGDPARASYRPHEDAVVVARMRAAGAVLLGKTNVGQGAPVYARPNNPHDEALTPGGSSSGEAAIIAAGGSPLGLGSDSGGSIRWPAHCCGIAGLKPTTGLVPNTGHFPRIGHMSDPRTTIGPMARSVGDLAVALRVIAGADAGDPGSVPVPIGDPAEVRLETLRVGWYTATPGAVPTADTVATVERAARTLAGLGCTVEAVAPPRLEEALPITEAYWAGVQSASFDEWRPPRASVLAGEQIDRARFEWERVTRDMLAFMRRYDVLLAPVAATPAPPHEGWGMEQYLYTLPYSLTGQPVVVVPFGRAEALPIGVQVVARPWQDAVALAVGEALEAAAAPASLPPPPLGR